MPKPLDVVFLLEDLCFGGTQKQNMELAARLDHKLFRPVALTLSGKTDMDEAVAASGVRVEHLGRGRRPSPLFFAALPAALKRLKPDILALCTALPNIWGRIWGRILKVPVILGQCRGGGAPARQHERLLWRLCDHLVCNSPTLVEAMKQKGVPGARLSYIPNGVDSRLYSPAQANNPDLIVCVARLAKDKDIETLLKAFAKAQNAIPTAALRLVGDGPEEKALRQFAQKALPPQAAARVEFAGASANAVEHYHAAAIFALSSIREGQPNVILEAMSCGLPICATSAGGIPFLVRHGENGLLCQPGDDAALAANIIELLRDKARAAALGATGRARIEREFSFAAMVDAHQKLLLSLWNKAQNSKKNSHEKFYK